MKIRFLHTHVYLNLIILTLQISKKLQVSPIKFFSILQYYLFSNSSRLCRNVMTQ